MFLSQPPSRRNEISVTFNASPGFSSEPAEDPIKSLSSSQIATFAREAIHATHVPYHRTCGSRHSSCGSCAGPATDVCHDKGYRECLLLPLSGPSVDVHR